MTTIYVLLEFANGAEDAFHMDIGLQSMTLPMEEKLFLGEYKHHRTP
jgi:hypothetical protein